MSDLPTNTPTPRGLTSDGDSLVIEWSDGVTHRLKWSLLRECCPCATCRTKQDEPPKQSAVLLPVIGLEETQPIRPTAMQPVGNYAYSIHFSDGHNTGIYTLDYLRDLGSGS